MSQLPTVVIAGRPNVGKSTLLNRIYGRREAIVEEKPGVTRDRKQVEVEWQGVRFDLVDTGGWLAAGSELDKKVSKQAEQAISEADVLLFVVDAMVGITEEDTRMVREVRSVEIPTLLVANKVDAESHESQIWDLLQLGLGEPYPSSALHGKGVADLLDAVIANFEPQEFVDEEEAERVFSIAIAGRPNVGKSTLFNQLIGEERSVVHDMAGTTRDTIDTVVSTIIGDVRFLDTAGMRRKSKVDDDTEYYSTVRALKSIDGADVALLVVDASEGVTNQDQRLAERIDAAGCPIVVVLNKVDLLSTEERETLNHQLERKLNFLPHVPVHRTSAKSGKGVEKLLPSLSTALDAYQTRVPTRKVTDIIRRAQQAQPAPAGARVLYATQGATDPPTFTLFANRSIPDHYLRYLERELREHCDLGATPVKLRVRNRDA